MSRLIKQLNVLNHSRNLCNKSSEIWTNTIEKWQDGNDVSHNFLLFLFWEAFIQERHFSNPTEHLKEIQKFINERNSGISYIYNIIELSNKVYFKLTEAKILYKPKILNDKGVEDRLRGEKFNEVKLEIKNDLSDFDVWTHFKSNYMAVSNYILFPIGWKKHFIVLLYDKQNENAYLINTGLGIENQNNSVVVKLQKNDQGEKINFDELEDILSEHVLFNLYTNPAQIFRNKDFYEDYYQQVFTNTYKFVPVESVLFKQQISGSCAYFSIISTIKLMMFLTGNHEKFETFMILMRSYFFDMFQHIQINDCASRSLYNMLPKELRSKHGEIEVNTVDEIHGIKIKYEIFQETNYTDDVLSYMKECYLTDSYLENIFKNHLRRIQLSKWLYDEYIIGLRNKHDLFKYIHVKTLIDIDFFYSYPESKNTNVGLHNQHLYSPFLIYIFFRNDIEISKSDHEAEYKVRYRLNQRFGTLLLFSEDQRASIIRILNDVLNFTRLTVTNAHNVKELPPKGQPTLTDINWNEYKKTILLLLQQNKSFSFDNDVDRLIMKEYPNDFFGWQNQLFSITNISSRSIFQLLNLNLPIQETVMSQKNLVKSTEEIKQELFFTVDNDQLDKVDTVYEYDYVPKLNLKSIKQHSVRTVRQYIFRCLSECSYSLKLQNALKVHDMKSKYMVYQYLEICLYVDLFNVYNDVSVVTDFRIAMKNLMNITLKEHKEKDDYKVYLIVIAFCLNTEIFKQDQLFTELQTCMNLNDLSGHYACLLGIYYKGDVKNLINYSVANEVKVQIYKHHGVNIESVEEKQGFSQLYPNIFGKGKDDKLYDSYGLVYTNIISDILYNVQFKNQNYTIKYKEPLWNMIQWGNVYNYRSFPVLLVTSQDDNDRYYLILYPNSSNNALATHLSKCMADNLWCPNPEMKTELLDQVEIVSLKRNKDGICYPQTSNINILKHMLYVYMAHGHSECLYVLFNMLYGTNEGRQFLMDTDKNSLIDIRYGSPYGMYFLNTKLGIGIEDPVGRWMRLRLAHYEEFRQQNMYPYFNDDAGNRIFGIGIGSGESKDGESKEGESKDGESKEAKDDQNEDIHLARTIVKAMFNSPYKYQIDFVKTINETIQIQNDENQGIQIRELLMGKGKTSIITPLLIFDWLLHKNESSVCVLLPQHLIKATNSEIIQNYSFALGIYDIQLITIFDKTDIPENYGNKVIILIDFNIIKHAEIVVNMEPDKIFTEDKLLTPKYKELVEKLKESCLICDEIDMLFDPIKSEYNLTINDDVTVDGETRDQEHREDTELVRGDKVILGDNKILSDIAFGNLLDGQDGIKNVKKVSLFSFIYDILGHIKSLSYEEKVFSTTHDAHNFIVMFIDEIWARKKKVSGKYYSQETIIEKWTKHVKNPNSPIDQNDQRQIVIWDNLFNALSLVLTKIYNKDYGFGTIVGDNINKIIPYSAVNRPNNGSEYSDTSLLLVLIMTGYINRGTLSYQDLLRIRSSPEMMALIKKLESKHNKPYLADIEKALANNSVWPEPFFIIYYLKYILDDIINIQKHKYSITAIDLLTTNFFTNENKVTFTGTSDFPIPGIDEEKQCSSTRTKNWFWAACKDKDKTGYMKHIYENCKIYREKNIDTLFTKLKDYGALIDAGALTQNTSFHELIDNLFKNIDNDKYNCIIYFHDGLPVYIRKDQFPKKQNQPITYIPLEQSDLKKLPNGLQAFLFYSQEYCTGSDVKNQPNELKALLTINYFNTTRDIEQAVFRLRKLTVPNLDDLDDDIRRKKMNDKQSVDFIVFNNTIKNMDSMTCSYNYKLVSFELQNLKPDANKLVLDLMDRTNYQQTQQKLYMYSHMIRFYVRRPEDKSKPNYFMVNEDVLLKPELILNAIPDDRLPITYQKIKDASTRQFIDEFLGAKNCKEDTEINDSDKNKSFEVACKFLLDNKALQTTTKSNVSVSVKIQQNEQQEQSTFNTVDNDLPYIRTVSRKIDDYLKFNEILLMKNLLNRDDNLTVPTFNISPMIYNSIQTNKDYKNFDSFDNFVIIKKNKFLLLSGHEMLCLYNYLIDDKISVYSTNMKFEFIDILSNEDKNILEMFLMNQKGLSKFQLLQIYMYKYQNEDNREDRKKFISSLFEFFSLIYRWNLDNSHYRDIDNLDQSEDDEKLKLLTQEYNDLISPNLDVKLFTSIFEVKAAQYKSEQWDLKYKHELRKDELRNDHSIPPHEITIIDKSSMIKETDKHQFEFFMAERKIGNVIYFVKKRSEQFTDEVNRTMTYYEVLQVEQCPDGLAKRYIVNLIEDTYNKIYRLFVKLDLNDLDNLEVPNHKHLIDKVRCDNAILNSIHAKNHVVPMIFEYPMRDELNEESKKSYYKIEVDSLKEIPRIGVFKNYYEAINENFETADFSISRTSKDYSEFIKTDLYKNSQISLAYSSTIYIRIKMNQHDLLLWNNDSQSKEGWSSYNVEFKDIRNDDQLQNEIIEKMNDDQLQNEIIEKMNDDKSFANYIVNLNSDTYKCTTSSNVQQKILDHEEIYFIHMKNDNKFYIYNTSIENVEGQHHYWICKSEPKNIVNLVFKERQEQINYYDLINYDNKIIYRVKSTFLKHKCTFNNKLHHIKDLNTVKFEVLKDIHPVKDHVENIKIMYLNINIFGNTVNYHHYIKDDTIYRIGINDGLYFENDIVVFFKSKQEPYRGFIYDENVTSIYINPSEDKEYIDDYNEIKIFHNKLGFDINKYLIVKINIDHNDKFILVYKKRGCVYKFLPYKLQIASDIGNLNKRLVPNKSIIKVSDVQIDNGKDNTNLSFFEQNNMIYAIKNDKDYTYEINNNVVYKSKYLVEVEDIIKLYENRDQLQIDDVIKWYDYIRVIKDYFLYKLPEFKFIDVNGQEKYQDIDGVMISDTDYQTFVKQYNNSSKYIHFPKVIFPTGNLHENSLYIYVIGEWTGTMTLTLHCIPHHSIPETSIFVKDKDSIRIIEKNPDKIPNEIKYNNQFTSMKFRGESQLEILYFKTYKFWYQKNLVLYNPRSLIWYLLKDVPDSCEQDNTIVYLTKKEVLCNILVYQEPVSNKSEYGTPIDPTTLYLKDTDLDDLEQREKYEFFIIEQQPLQ